MPGEGLGWGVFEGKGAVEDFPLGPFDPRLPEPCAKQKRPVDEDEGAVVGHYPLLHETARQVFRQGGALVLESLNEGVGDHGFGLLLPCYASLI